MICGEPALDSDDISDWDSEGVYWVYCRQCDCWTEHPVPLELRDIPEWHKEQIRKETTEGKQ